MGVEYDAKEETFNRWYENPIDLPGRWYLQVIAQLFKENRLAKGEFIGLGRKLNLRNTTCPTYLLAGAAGAGARRREISWSAK
jgi:poly(3-hydroxyalkanoate) synthetase